MTTSGTYTFAPSLAELVLNAYGRIGVQGPELLQKHLVTARLETNLLLQAWSNLGVNLWAVDLQTQTLSVGTASYTLAESTVAVLDAYITSAADGTDRVIFPVSRTEYASFADKTTTGTSTVFWFNRQIIPTLTLWQPPDTADTLKYYRMRAIQDANLASGETLDLPDRFIDAFTAGLAHRLSRHYAPAVEDKRKMDASDAWLQAGGADVESVPIHVTPMLSGYFR